jgi:hypothetical protein
MLTSQSQSCAKPVRSKKRWNLIEILDSSIQTIPFYRDLQISRIMAQFQEISTKAAFLSQKGDFLVFQSTQKKLLIKEDSNWKKHFYLRSNFDD